MTTNERRKTPEYAAWSNMKQRCQNRNNPRYSGWGGRGITVCERWQTFANFYADMGERPNGLTLDRIDNDGNYEPGNCRWSTPTQQRMNQRKREGANDKEKNKWLRILMSETARDELHALAQDYHTDTISFCRAAFRYMDEMRPVLELKSDAPKRGVV